MNEGTEQDYSKTELAFDAPSSEGIEAPHVLGLAMVKNEQSIIEAFVRHNIRFLRHFVILDNGSIDGTSSILEELAGEFPSLVVLHEERFGYTQSEIMTALLHQWQSTFSADYAVALDADEFLDATSQGSLSELLGQIPVEGFGLIPWCTYVVTPDFDPAASSDWLREMHWRRRQEEPQYYKVVVRLDGASAEDLSLEQGNHMVRTLSGHERYGTVMSGLRLLHYPVRSREQIVAKTVVGWMAYLAVNTGAGNSKLGNQWRANFHQIVRGSSLDHQALCEMSLLYTQTPRKIDWAHDLVYERSRLVYDRKYSSGAAVDTITLIALSWEQSLLSSHRVSATTRVAKLIGGSSPDLYENQGTGHLQLGTKAAESLEDLIGDGRINEALDLLSKAIAKRETAELWNDWATIQCGRGEHHLAEQAYRRALYLDGSSRAAAINLGIFLMTQGKVEEGSALVGKHAATLTKDEREAIDSFSGTLTLEAALPIKKTSLVVQKRRFLVVVRAGDSSLHPQWLEGDEARSWDLLVHSFGEECPWTSEDGVEVIRATGAEIKGPKLRAIHHLYEKKRDYFLAYDYVFFPDDDLAADVVTINRLFFLAEHFSLHYAQPALTHDSFMGAWGITMENRSFLLRYTNFVEMMAPVFSRAYLQLCAPTFAENISGYGLDLLWSSWIPSPWKIGILDACPMRHTRPFRVGKLYDTLKELGADPDQELIDVVRKWQLVKEKDQISGRVVVPTSQIRGGILRDQTRVTVQDGQGMLLLQSLINGFPPELAQDQAKALSLLVPVIQNMVDC